MAIEHTIDTARERASGRGDLLAGLNPSQREAVVSDAEPLCILAGAGSGKTRVLTRRIAYRITTGSIDASRVLAVTFTRKAAGELRDRLGRIGVRESVTAGTFHALAYAQLRRRWADTGRPEPAVLESKVRLLGPLLARRTGTGGGALQPADVAAEIEWAKARGVTPVGYAAAAEAAGRTPPLAATDMAAVFQRYEDEKRKRRLVDFDDLLVAAAAAFAEDDEFAAAQRWRFRHLFVDEFQDLNPVQYELLRGWLGPRTDLCVVGDPNQAIYSWNGADPRYLTEFGRFFPGASVVRLAENYRSTPQVLSVAAAVLHAGATRHRARGLAGVDLRPTKPDGPVPVVRAYETEVAEARAVARAIRGDRNATRPWSHFAILCRTNAQAVLFEEALRAASIPVRVRGGGAFLQQPEIRDVLSEIRRAPAAVPLISTLRDIELAVESGPGHDDRRASIQSLVRLGHEYAAADDRPSASGFLAWLSATMRGGDDTRDGGDAVEIATFHRAKGLEWPVVFVTGLERGFVPVGRAATPEAEAEENRLLYVALTRAESELYCSWAQRRTFGTRSVPRQPSPWLESIEAATMALRAVAPGADWPARLAAERSKLDAARARRTGATASRPGPKVVGAEADPRVLDALKAWRSDVARTSKVPAYVIFHDTTLAAVAEARPRTRDDLLALPGLGPVKAERYGDDLLQVIARAS